MKEVYKGINSSNPMCKITEMFNDVYRSSSESETESKKVVHTLQKSSSSMFIPPDDNPYAMVGKAKVKVPRPKFKMMKNSFKIK